MKYIIASCAFCLMLLPMVADAQTGGLVTCQGPDCNWCTFVELVNNIIRWLVMFLSVIAVIVMVYAGFLMVTSGGSVDAWQKGKKMFTSVIIGIIIVLAAWLIVDTVLATLTGKDLNEWFPDDCGGALPTLTSEGPEQGAPTGIVVVPSGNLVSYGGYRFDSGVVDNMQYISENYNLRVSGGHRTPERNAQVNGAERSYHLYGTAGDFVGSRSDMEAAARWARNNGAKESFVHDAGSGTHLHVAF